MSSRLRALGSATRMIMPVIGPRRRCTPGLSAVRFRSKYSAGRLPARIRQSIVGAHATATIGPSFLQRSLLKVLCIAPTSCLSHRGDSGPSIEFTHIPPAAQGGRQGVDTISGRVRNARPSSGLLFMRTVGRGGCSPGRLTSDPDGDR